jgi:hypothetical protein
MGMQKARRNLRLARGRSRREVSMAKRSLDEMRRPKAGEREVRGRKKSRKVGKERAGEESRRGDSEDAQSRVEVSSCMRRSSTGRPTRN